MSGPRPRDPAQRELEERLIALLRSFDKAHPGLKAAHVVTALFNTVRWVAHATGGPGRSARLAVAFDLVAYSENVQQAHDAVDEAARLYEFAKAGHAAGARAGQGGSG